MFPLINMALRAGTALLLTAGLTVAVGCTGEIGSGGGSGGTVDPSEMAGAGGRDISEYWPEIDVPLSQNTRMLNFEMLRSEVARATGRSWLINSVDQWERNRGPLGGADYMTSFSDDLIPSQQRIVLIRKMAFQVCGDLVAAEAGASPRSVFTELDPGAAFDAGGATAKAQIQAMYRRFYLEEATPVDLTEGEVLLRALSPSGNESRAAWRGLCASYLASMRFLSY